MTVLYFQDDFSIDLEFYLDKQAEVHIRHNDELTVFPLDENTKICGSKNVDKALDIAWDFGSQALQAMLLVVSKIDKEAWLSAYCLENLKLNKLPKKIPEGGLAMIEACSAQNLHPSHLSTAMITHARGAYSINGHWKPEVAFLLGVGYNFKA
jgi:hypothetical protein